ncbi:MAG: hypothetical protein QF512_14145 [Alphaproteobacteria bacterium]|nr:hypothetical protein [Alphaproteobacteria bacterium]
MHGVAVGLFALKWHWLGGFQASVVGQPGILIDILGQQRRIHEALGKADGGGEAVFDMVVRVLQQQIQ